MKIFWVFIVLVKLVAGDTTERKSGPYKSVLLGVNDCKNTTHPPDKDSPVQIYIKAVGAFSSGSPRDRVLVGNITVLRNTKDVKLKIKSFTWDGVKWRLTILMDHVSCHGRLLNMVSQALSFTMFDTTKCAVLKGTYTFTRIDINKIQHLLMSTMEYGRVLWRSEFSVGQTYYCWEFATEVERA